MANSPFYASAWFVWAWFGLFILTPVTVRGADPGSTEFFEAKIRPVLVRECYSCHAAEAVEKKKLRGGLLLDTKPGLLAGGDSGPALIPGKPEESLLLSSLRYDGDLQMPPKGKLSDSVIRDFEAWIAAGAFDPREASTSIKKQVGPTVEEGRKLWPYQPLNSPGRTIDDLILSALSERSLQPAPPATRAELLRRVTFDLTGLPPTPEELAAFETDTHPEAFARVVDRLLASPAFGEHWGRHWLDVARYADSVTLRGFVFPEAWRYRNYIIDAYNRDVPFDRLIREQLAGDLLDYDSLEAKQNGHVATTFLMLGNINWEEQDKKALDLDLVDEQLDVITRGFLAMTVSCARCHDHKFDPIPTTDYYALAGILSNVQGTQHSNVSQWIETPLPVPPAEEARFAAQEEAIAQLQKQIATLKKQAGKPGPLAIAEVPGIVVDDTAAMKVGPWTTSIATGVYIGSGYVFSDPNENEIQTITFTPAKLDGGTYEVLLSYSHSPSRASNVPVTVFSAEGEKTILVDMKKQPAIEGRFISLGEYRFEQGGQAYVLISTDGTKGHVTADAIVFRTKEQKAAASGSSAGSAKPSTTAEQRLKLLETELKALQAQQSKRPMVMSVIEKPKIQDLPVMIRGNVHAPGEVAPRGVLSVATRGPSPSFPPDQSGRKELAAWIASPKNPLTARVYANRVWHWLFGQGIVRTVDNFGLTGELPSNAALLDQLAANFIESGWSTKSLVRQIVLSEAYQRSSRVVPAELLAADPENRRFGRANRKPLEAESLRDAMLAISGALDRTPAQRLFPDSLKADYGYNQDAPKRSIYLPYFRNALPEMIAVFNPADPSVTTGVRSTSTVAPQALFLRNHKFPAEQARLVVAKLKQGAYPSMVEQVDALYVQVLGRRPTEQERTIVLNYLQQGSAEDPWPGLVHALFASADFRYLD